MDINHHSHASDIMSIAFEPTKFGLDLEVDDGPATERMPKTTTDDEEATVTIRMTD